MSALLDEIIEAAGGRERWAEVTAIDLDFDLGGGMWGRFGRADVTGPRAATVVTTEQRVVYRGFGSADVDAEYTPDRVVLHDRSGGVVGERRDARAALVARAGQPWDLLDTVHFAGYALWNYLNVPHLFARDDVGTTELEPWTERSEHTDGRPERWRRLEATFPSSIATHAAVQVFFFDEHGRQRRHDYAADVFGGTPTSHYTDAHREFDGIVVPTRRRVVPRDPVTGLTESGPVLVSLDLGAVRVR